jgi:Domain of Unknown Function (DUF1543)
MLNFDNVIFDSPKLYIFYLGGKVEGCNIEMHDVIFIVGKSNTEIVNKLKTKWCGTKKSLHIDSWFMVESIDGFDIEITENKPIDTHHYLFFINLGFYRAGIFGEDHLMTLIVAESRSKAIVKAKLKAPKDQEMLHSDNIYNIDDCIRIDRVDNYHIILKYTGNNIQNTITNGYQKLP